MGIKMIIKLILTVITLISCIAFWLLKDDYKKDIALIVGSIAVTFNLLIY